MTAFEPEARGHRVEGLDFHKFYFALAASDPTPPKSIGSLSHMSSPKVTLMAGGQSAIITYIRLIQKAGNALVNAPAGNFKKPQRNQQGAAGWFNPAPPPRYEEFDDEDSARGPVLCAPPSMSAFEETRVWERQQAGNWLCMHFHRSEA